MRGDNICIWKLEKSIEEIIPLLQEVYSKNVEILQDYDIPEDDKQLIFRWNTIDGNYSIQEVSIDDTKLRYINASAEVESNLLSQSEWIFDEKPLPKRTRVKNFSSRVWFVERLGVTYCIVKGSKSIEGKIRSNLMESSKGKKSRWGRFEFKEIAGYTFDKHFYYWLIKNKGNTITVDDKEILINDVRGFKSDAAERSESSYSGEGSNIDYEIPLKSLISMDERLISLYIDIVINKVSYNFFLEYDGRISVNRGECGQFTTQEPKLMSIGEIIFNIYYEIIPMLIMCFNKAKTKDWLDEEDKFKRKLSIEVIIALINQNNIDIKEIEDAIIV